VHSAATRNEFLRLRVQGLSLARIGRQLHVSKPTLIAWSRQAQPQISSAILADQQHLTHELATAASEELAGLHRKLTALKQELFSRALRDIPTPHLETLLGQVRQRIAQLKTQNSQLKTPQAPNPSEPNRTQENLFSAPRPPSNQSTNGKPNPPAP
jgi:hypothetical protein